MSKETDHVTVLEQLQVAVGEFLHHPALQYDEIGPVIASHYALNALWDAYDATCPHEEAP